MTISTNNHIQEKNNTEIRSRFGPYQIMLYEEIQNNGGCLEATGPDRGCLLLNVISYKENPGSLLLK